MKTPSKKTNKKPSKPIDPWVALERVREWDKTKGLSSRQHPSHYTNLEKITCVSPTLGGNKFLIILNDNYSKDPLVADKAKGSWDLLFRIAEGEQVPYKREYKNSIDYFNSNPKNKLYTQGNFGKAKILRIENRFIIQNIKINVISEKAFKTRQKKAESNLA